jgi:NADH-quinone oxidoreductase subunit M
MKLGAYGALRAGVALFPAGLAAWQDVFMGLAVAGILFGGLVALVQRDFKFVIGYSSVSHMGFVLLGLVTLTPLGLGGAVLQMVSHGLIAGLLFAVVGRMVYDRAHTRELEELAGLRLARRLPFAAGTFLLAGMASMGLPGFSGFVAELSVLVGAWEARPAAAVLTGAGIVVGAAYIWRALQKAFAPEAAAGDQETAVHADRLEPITWPERVGAGLLLAATVGLGLFPGVVMDYILPSARAVLATLRAGGI